jgi:hypothetical protein
VTARSRSPLAAAVLALALVIPACSSDGSSSKSSSTPVGTAVAAAPPLVDQIRPAIAALEAKLGGPQQYFEINATGQLVNLFVALNNETMAQAWVYLDGELSAKDGQAAQGHTFAASALTFDAAKVLQPTQAKLPGSTIELFVIEGGDAGAVRYTLAVTSTGQGELLVTVGPDGTVASVDSN